MPKPFGNPVYGLLDPPEQCLFEFRSLFQNEILIFVFDKLQLMTESTLPAAVWKFLANELQKSFMYILQGK